MQAYSPGAPVARAARSGNSCPLPSTAQPTDSTPSVSVPVLSVNRMFMLPAASIPTGLRTSTWSRTILRMLEDSTTAIIMGSPSGTATTSTVSPSVAAWKQVFQTQRQSDSRARMTARSNPVSNRKAFSRKISATSAAAR